MTDQTPWHTLIEKDAHERDESMLYALASGATCNELADLDARQRDLCRRIEPQVRALVRDGVMVVADI